MLSDEPSARVAFIAGTSWSGSTILEQALAQIEGCTTVGESFWVWDPDWPWMTCECGREFRHCEFWQGVLTEAYGSGYNAIRSQVRARSEGLWRHSILPTLLRSKSRFQPTAALAELGAMVEPIYRAVASLSGSSTIVDASKSGLWGLAISMCDTVDLHVVHLVRDPMGFVASDGRSRELPYPPGATRPPRRPTRSLVTWLLLNLEAEILTRRVPDSMLVLYDELVREPSKTLALVARTLGLHGDLAGVFADDELRVHRSGHAIGGNPRRPKLGPTVIRRDESKPVPVLTPELVRYTLVPMVRDRYERYVASAKAR